MADEEGLVERYDPDLMDESIGNTRKAVNYILTDFKYPQDLIEGVAEFADVRLNCYDWLNSHLKDGGLRDQVRCSCWQLERSPTTGRLHIQAFVSLKKSTRCAWMRKHFKKCNVTICRGTPDQVHQYCTKEQTRVFGPYYWRRNPANADDASMFLQALSSCGKGARNDLKELREKVEQGLTSRELAKAVPDAMFRHGKLVSSYRSLVEPLYDPDDELVIINVLGEAGVGKSQWVWEQLKELLGIKGMESQKKMEQFHKFVLMKEPSNWYDFYDGQRIIVLDDFDGSKMSYAELNRVCGRYKLYCEIKGSTVNRRWNVVIITSVGGVRTWYPERREWSEFERRPTMTVTFPTAIGFEPDMVSIIRERIPDILVRWGVQPNAAAADTRGVGTASVVVGPAEASQISDTLMDAFAQLGEQFGEASDHYLARIENEGEFSDDEEEYGFEKVIKRKRNPYIDDEAVCE